MIDVSHKADHAYAISVQDIHDFESKYGKIRTGNFVLAYTGWGKKWPDVEQYRNQGINGIMTFPHFSIEAAHLLVEKNITGIGIDTLSPDSGSDQYPVHELFLSRGKYIVENVCYVDTLPAVGMTIIIAPLAIQGATESPVRMFAVHLA